MTREYKSGASLQVKGWNEWGNCI